jgi:hypothetical protein
MSETVATILVRFIMLAKIVKTYLSFCFKSLQADFCAFFNEVAVFVALIALPTESLVERLHLQNCLVEITVFEDFSMIFPIFLLEYASMCSGQTAPFQVQTKILLESVFLSKVSEFFEGRLSGLVLVIRVVFCIAKQTS